jgi:hypothetical protein
MRTLLITTAAVAALALGACTREETAEAGNETEAAAADAGNSAEAAAAKIGEGAKDLVNSPEVKNAGAELKEAAGDVAAMAKEAGGEAKEAVHDATAPDAQDRAREDAARSQAAR